MDTAPAIRKATDSLSESELSPEEIDREVKYRIGALQSATKEEIKQAIVKTKEGSTAKTFLQAFLEKERATLSREEVERIAVQTSRIPSSVQRSNINIAGVLPKNSFFIEAEKQATGIGIIAWTLQNTRIQLFKGEEIPPQVTELHETAQKILPSLGGIEANLLYSLIGQYLGLPLNHLALFCEIEAEVARKTIEKINNEHFKDTRVFIHLRNGVVILGSREKNDNISIVDNEETRKNLFLKKSADTKKLRAKIDELETALTAALIKAQSAEERAARLETDIETALSLAASAQNTATSITQKEQDLALKDTKDDLKKARLDTEVARRENQKLRQQLTAALQATERAEEARASLKRSQGRGPDRSEEEQVIRNLREGIRRTEEEMASLKRHLTTERSKTAVSPQELVRLKAELSAIQLRLEEKNRRITELEKQNRQQQSSPGLTQLRADLDTKSNELEQAKTELDAKSTEIKQLETEISRLRDEIEKLTREVREANDLLAQLTDPDTAQATKTVAPATKTTTPTANSTQPDQKKPKSPEIEDPILTIRKTASTTQQSLVTEVKRALAFHGGGRDGLPKTKLRELRDALTALSDLEDWTKTARNTMVRMLQALKEGTTGKSIPVIEVQKCMDELAQLAE